MTKTAAIKQAREDVTLRRQGSGWILGSYDPEARAIRESHEMPWPEARQARADEVVARALMALGMPRDNAEHLANLVDCGRIPERVDHCLLAGIARGA